MFESINVVGFFLRTPGVLFHIGGKMKGSVFCLVLVFPKGQVQRSSFKNFIQIRLVKFLKAIEFMD